MRLLFISGFVCSFIFYYLMLDLNPKGTDFFNGRLITAAVSLIGLIASFIPQLKRNFLSFFFDLLMVSYLILYLYLLHINDWSMLHRWSFFVVAAISCSCVINWRDFIITAGLAIIAPVIVGFFSTLSPIELLHFHTANITVFFVIGLSVRANFRYRNEVEVLTKSLVQNSSMSALGEMASGMAHEINNPLMSIISLVTLARHELEIHADETKLRTLFDKVEQTSLRIGKIIQGLRNFSRDTSKDSFEMVDLAEVISITLAFCAEKFKSVPIEIEFKKPDKPVNCFCQRNQIAQLLHNLLANAYDACQNIPAAKVIVTLKADYKNALISVCDNGSGVPRTLEDKIMQPFFTTKNIGKGPGLGLSICLGIAESNHGKFYLDRSVSGSCFVLSLPLSENL